MPLQSGITIAGLGAGAPADITLGVWEALKASSRILLRTGKHPVVKWLSREGIRFSTFDHVYEEESDFQEVYARIAEEVIGEARRGQVLYAVPGHPLVAEESVRLIIRRAEQEKIGVNLLPAVSFLDALFSALRLDPCMGLQIVDGLRLDEEPPQPGKAAVITQVYSRLVASDVKLALLEVYPPEHPVTVVRGAGIPGEERIETIPLFELDRLKWVDHLTSLYVPEISRQTSDVRHQIKDEEGAFNPSCRFPLDPLVDIMARLRGEEGCPWDREQDHRTLKKYLLEETYEVLEALDEEDTYKICEELGDLLLQIVFHAQIATENRHFDINDVVAGISEKMIRRHPHVFGSVEVRDSDEVIRNWEKIKEKEKGGNLSKSFLAGVSMSLPALMRAAKLQQKASGAGFDWPDYKGALDKVREELGELESAISSGDIIQIEGELGDLIFSAVNLARLLGVEPEAALSGTCAKFIRRFGHVEKMVRLKSREPSQCTLTELDMWWEEAKKQEKNQE